MFSDSDLKSINQLHKSLLLYSFAIIAITLFSAIQKQVYWLSFFSFIGYLTWVGRYFYLNKELSFPYGPANSITLLRFFGLFTVTLLHPGLSYFITGFFLTLICLGDILDGYVARALKMRTLIGEYMDKEADALFVLLSTFILYQKGFTGSWILALGLIRYVYFILVYFRLKPNQKEHKDPTARVIATIVFISILSCYFIPYNLSFPVLAGSSLLLCYSFVKSALIALELIQIRKE